MSKKSVNLTEGNILKQLIIFAIPILVGQLFQTLYNSVDSIVVGNFVGTSALAAVTASSSIAMFISGFFNGMSAGASVLFSRSFGGKRYDDLNNAIHTTMLFSIILGVILAGIGIILAPQLLILVNCPSDVYASAMVYLRIYLVGILFTSIYNIAAGVLRSVGDSQSPFYYLVISSVLNIILDIIFVAVFKIGVAGVGIATVIAQLVSVVLSMLKMGKMPEEYRYHFTKMRIDWRLLKEVINLGLPAGIQSSIQSISTIYVQRYINSFSSAAVAGIGSGMKIDQFCGMPCNALGLAMTTYVGQNLGADKKERARKGVGIATIAVIVQVAIFSVLVYIFAPNLMRIFGSDPEMIQYGTGFLHTIMPVYFLMGLSGLFGGIVRGYGYSKTAMAISIFGMVIVRQVWLAVSLNANYVISNVYVSYPIAWASATIPLLAFYFFYIRKKFKEN